MSIDVDRSEDSEPPITRIGPPVVEAEVHAGGTRTRYLRAGAGPTLLLLHGAGERAEVWTLWIERLASRFRVLAPDRRWRSRRRGPLPPGEAAARGTWLRDFLDGLGVETVRIVASGEGAEIAERFAAKYPERVTALLRVDPAEAADPVQCPPSATPSLPPL